METGKDSLIYDFLSLKKNHQELFFKYQQILSENENLKIQLVNLQKELNSKNEASAEINVIRENQKLIAKVKQLRRSSALAITPKKSSAESNNTFQVYEVERLMKHRGRKGKREFLVRWKNFDHGDDTWEKEANLSCPEILNKYKTKHNVA